MNCKFCVLVNRFQLLKIFLFENKKIYENSSLMKTALLYIYT